MLLSNLREFKKLTAISSFVLFLISWIFWFLSADIICLKTTVWKRRDCFVTSFLAVTGEEKLHYSKMVIVY